MRFIFLSVLFLAFATARPASAAPTAPTRFETPAQLAEFLTQALGELPDFPVVVRPPLPPDLAATIRENQPQSGSFLLAPATDLQNPLHNRALQAWMGSSDSMSAAQITAYLQRAMRFEVALRPHYAEGFDASARFYYSLQHDWAGLPPEMVFKSAVTHLLDGQPYGVIYRGNGPMSTSGWLHTDKLERGRHSAAMQMDFTWEWHDLQGEGSTESPDFPFEIVNGTVPDDLEAIDTPAAQTLLRESLVVAEKPDAEPVFNGPFLSGVTDAAHDPWKPQTTTRDAAGNALAARVPTWELKQALPFALAFDVEIHDVASDRIFRGDRILVPAGQTRGGFFFPDSLRDFAGDRDGVLEVKFVLQPSYDLALSEPAIKTFFGGVLTFDDLHIRITRPKK